MMGEWMVVGMQMMMMINNSFQPTVPLHLAETPRLQYPKSVPLGVDPNPKSPAIIMTHHR